MASCKKDNLECPVCIDVIENATILNCGHTFCRECLEEIYQLSGACLSCPVCRAETTLTEKGVEGLPRNVMINSLADDYHVSLNSAKACPFHKEHEKEFFCQECKVHICMRCVVTGHLNHQMKTKEDFEREIKEKIDCLMQRGQAKKEDMETKIASGKLTKTKVASAVVNLKRCIKNAFARKSRLLKENETFLLEEIHSLQSSYDSSIDEDTMPYYKQVVDDINRALAVITADDPGSLEADSLASHTMVCNDLDELLNGVLEKVDAKDTGRAKEAVMNAEFHPSRDGLLNLGMVKTKKMELVMMDVMQLPSSVEGLAAQSEDIAKVENGACRSYEDRVKEWDDKCQLTEADDYRKDPECDDDQFEYSEADHAENVMQNEMERHIRSCTEADNVENSECDDDDRFVGYSTADQEENWMQNEIEWYIRSCTEADNVENSECDDDDGLECVREAYHAACMRRNLCSCTETDNVENSECDDDEFVFSELADQLREKLE